MAASRSIQRRLLASSLMAVLSGYVFLQMAEAGLASASRRQRHGEAVDATLLALRTAPSGAERRLLVQEAPLSRLRFSLEPAPFGATTESRITVVRSGTRTYLSSNHALLLDGKPQKLIASEEITEELAREHIVRLLLLVFAGLALLLTGALLRPVLRRGLEQPLARLSIELGRAPLPPAPPAPIDASAQPLELQPIVRSFNDLQRRLADSWEEERSFVDGAAHELRTPITLISGYAQRLQRQIATGGAGDPAAVRAIAAEAGHMASLVRDLLDLARDQAGRLALSPAPLDLDDQLLEAYERLEPLAPGRLRLHAPSEFESRRVHADGERLQQCLTNLVENALKHTPAGAPIELFSSATPTHLIAHVRDHGPGVNPADRERIFERFARGSSSTVSGSGIGLAIVRLLMERMGGSVQVLEALGGGADFQLVLPPDQEGKEGQH